MNRSHYPKRAQNNADTTTSIRNILTNPFTVSFSTLPEGLTLKKITEQFVKLFQSYATQPTTSIKKKPKTLIPMGAGLPYTTGLRCISRHLKHLSATETPRTEDRCLVLLFRFDNPHCAHMYAAIPPLVAQCGEAVRMADLPQGTLARIRTYLPVAKISALLLKASFNGFEDLWKLAPVTDPSPKPWMLALQDKDERSRDEPTSGEKMDIDSSPEQKKSCAELPELTPERMAKPFAAPMKIKSLVTTIPVKKRGNRGQGKVKGKPTRKGPETLQPTVAGKKRSAPPSQAVPSGRGKARST